MYNQLCGELIWENFSITNQNEERQLQLDPIPKGHHGRRIWKRERQHLHSRKGTQKNLMEWGRQHVGSLLRVKENEVLSSCQKNITEMTKSYYENYHYLFGKRDTYKTRPDRRNPTRIHLEGTKTWGDWLKGAFIERNTGREKHSRRDTMKNWADVF